MIAGIFGDITNPTAYTSDKGSGLFTLLSNLFKLAGVIAGIFFVVQVIIAGFTYLSANGDPKKTEAAWTQIWQSILGLAIVASAFVIATVIGKITGINPLQPTLYGPN